MNGKYMLSFLRNTGIRYFSQNFLKNKVFLNNFIQKKRILPFFAKNFHQHKHGDGCGCSHEVDPKQVELESKLKTMNSNIIQAINAGKLDTALDLSDEFLKEIKDNLGEDHPFYCHATNNKAFILKTGGEYETAEPLFKDVVERYKKMFGEKNERVVISKHNLATLYRDWNQYEKALNIYEELLGYIKNKEIQEDQATNPMLRKTILANIYNSAGGLYRRLKHFKEADEMLSNAFNIIKENHGEKTLPMATVLNNMGMSFKDQGKFEEALSMYNKALEIRKTNLPADHPEIKMIQANIEQLKEVSSNKI
jgi:tetratricopeptide (TPR) repeat protein